MIKENRTVRTFWSIFFGVLAALAIAITLITFFVYRDEMARIRRSVVADDNYYKIQLENKYKESLYIATDSMKNIDANLGKVSVSKDKTRQIELLSNIVIHANNVSQNVSELPVPESDNLARIETFANQTQDYALFLIKKVSAGEELSVSDKASLLSLDATATALTGKLTELSMSDSAMFITNGMGLDGSSSLGDGIDDMDENIFKYEKLIYDGPFSESTAKKFVKTERKIAGKDGIQLIEKYFDGEIASVSYEGAINNKGTFYAYKAQGADGEMRILMTTDGRVAEFEYYMDSAEKEMTEKSESCSKKAEEFARKLGFEVNAVWVSKTQDFVTYVNLAPVTDDGIIVYPDLVKVAVDCSSGKIVGLESRAYIMNHSTRDMKIGGLDAEKAGKMLDGSLKVKSVNYALVAKSGNEYVCHEFECNAGNRKYFVYIDSETGKEVELFKVVENSEGYSVM